MRCRVMRVVRFQSQRLEACTANPAEPGWLTSSVRQIPILMPFKKLKIIVCALAALVTTIVMRGAPPTPEEALEYAKTVVLVRRVLKDNLIHSYVKEIWRYAADAGSPPPVGSEYRDAMPYDERAQHPERDGIVFTFAKDRPQGLPLGWIIPVMEDGRVFPFQLDVKSVKIAVEKTKP
jgi:hypothetical protein